MEKQNPVITHEVDGRNILTIYINGKMNLKLNSNAVDLVYSHFIKNSTDHFIEIVLESGVHLQLKYDTFFKFESVLSRINNNI